MAAVAGSQTHRNDRLHSSNGVAPHQRKSAFNHFYLNDRFKDLLSIQTRRDQRTAASKDVVGELNLNLREATTQAPTMIQRLHQETAEQTQLKNRASLDSGTLL